MMNLVFQPIPQVELRRQREHNFLPVGCARLRHRGQPQRLPGLTVLSQHLLGCERALRITAILLPTVYQVSRKKTHPLH